MAEPTITLRAAPTVPSEPWWPALHSTIIASFLHKPTHSAFPPTWTRLNPDPARGAQGLVDELGNRGTLAVVFIDGVPVACGGVLPFRGENWIAEVEGKGDAEIAEGAQRSVGAEADGIADWEICCFCIAPPHRGRSLSRTLLSTLVAHITPLGAERLFTNYAEIETGAFWPRLGFEVIPGAGGVLKKGFQTDPAKEGLREDVVFSMGVMKVGS